MDKKYGKKWKNSKYGKKWKNFNLSWNWRVLGCPGGPHVSPDLVLLNIRKLDFHDFRYFLKVTSSQNTFKWAPNGGPKGPLPWDLLGSQGFPSHGGSGTPPIGSLGLPRVSPPMGSLWAPKGPLPWDPTLSNPVQFFVRRVQN